MYTYLFHAKITKALHEAFEAERNTKRYCLRMSLSLPLKFKNKKNWAKVEIMSIVII